MINQRFPRILLTLTVTVLLATLNPTYAENDLRLLVNAHNLVSLAKYLPIADNKSSLKAGKKLYLSSTQAIACQQCHGKKGDGKGPIAYMFNPPPRNFACVETIKGTPDGQLF